MILIQALKNFIDNKARSAAIIITIALAIVMLFMSLIYSHIVKEEFYNNKAVEAENIDIRIEYSPDSDTRIVNITPLNAYNDEIEFAVGVLDLYGMSNLSGNVHYINLRGITEDGFNQLNDTVIINSIGRKLRKDEIIIDQTTSQELSLSLDSHIDIKVGDKTKTFYVAEIVEDHPIFRVSGVSVIYGIETYISEYVGGGFGGIYNKIFIKAKSDVDKDNLIQTLSEISEYEDYIISYERDVNSMDEQAEQFALPISIGLVGCACIALFMVFLIINAGYKKRIGFISEMKSLGASNGYLTNLFLIESIFYIILGMLIGLLINNIMLRAVIPSFMNIDSGNSYYSLMIYLSNLIAGILVLLLVIYPIIRCRKISVRKARLQSIGTLWKGRNLYLIISIALIITSISLFIFSNYLNYLRGIISLILCVIGIIMISPFITCCIGQLILKIKQNGKGIWRNAVNNVKSERSIVSNVRIIIAGIIICTIISSAAMLTSVIGKQLIDDVDCDIIIRNVKGDSESQMNTISGIDGVYDLYAYQFEKVDFNIADIDYHIHIFGINPDDINFMGDIEYITPENQAIELLNNGGMLIDYMYFKVFKINIGDEIPITINNITKNLRVDGFYKSFQYAGRTAIISSDTLSGLYEIPTYDTIILKTINDVDATVLEIRSLMGMNNLIVLNKHTVYKLAINLINNAIDFAYYFTLIIILVCFISIIINILNSREERKFEKYQMLSLGFSRLHLLKIELLENVLSGIISLIISIFALLIINYSIINILSISKIYIDSVINIEMFFIIGSVFLLTYIAISFSSYYSINKNDLIKILKY